MTSSLPADLHSRSHVPRSRTAALLVLLLTATMGCGSRHESRAERRQQRQVDSLAEQAAKLATPTDSPVGRATIPDRIGMPQLASVAASDTVRITSTNGVVVYSLVHDTVRMQLGDSLVRKVRQDVSASADSAEGNFGGFIARTVAGAVGSAMAFVIKTPVRDIRTARYEDGQLRLETEHGLVRSRGVHVGNKGDDSTVFARDDAERFIAAIHARQRALGVAQ